MNTNQITSASIRASIVEAFESARRWMPSWEIRVAIGMTWYAREPVNSVLESMYERGELIAAPMCDVKDGGTIHESRLLYNVFLLSRLQSHVLPAEVREAVRHG